jgi:parvulin-like peptidyl-prolyl isomerase
MLARRAATLILVSFVLLSACKRKPAIPPDVIARVNERMLTLTDFKRYLVRNAGTDLAQLTPEVASAMLDEFVDEIVVSEYAASHGIEVPSDKIAEAVRTQAGATVIEKRDEMRREKLLVGLSTEIADPADAEIRNYYEQNQNDFRSGEEVRVRQIIVQDENLANEIVKQLRSGAPFPELSAQHSLAPNAKRGGEIGFVSRGELPKMFEDQIFSLKAAGISDPIRTDSSFHIFRVDERRPPGILDLQTAAPLIVNRLKEEAIRERVNQLKAKSRQEMKIAVLTRRIPFRYTGAFPKAETE